MKISIIKRYKPDLSNVLFNTAQQIFAKTIASDLVPVQPMSPPTGKLVYFDFPNLKTANTSFSIRSQSSESNISDRIEEILKRNNPFYGDKEKRTARYI